MTDKQTPTDAELEALLLDKLPASKHYIRPVIGKMVAAMQAAIDKWATPPAEQQAPKETLGGVNGWRDISTAPKDGSRFVATGHNYELYSEVRHTCVAQWFQGCWMEASDWNETSELKYLTHWMPLPSPPDDVAAPSEQQAAPKATQAQAVAVPLDEARRLFDAGWKAAALFCDREDVVADGIIGFSAGPQFEAAFSAAHGIKGGQHG